MKTKFLIGSLAIALAAGTLVVFHTHAADAPATPRPLARGHLLERAKEKLGITDAQAAQIKAQLKSEKSNLIPLLTHLHDVRSNLRQAIQAADATESSVRVASAKVASVEADMAVERLKLHAKIAPILTSDQQQKLQEMEKHMDDFVDLAINRIGARLAE